MMSSQTNLQGDNKGSVDELLTSTEREALKMIAAGNDLHGQRASALLAIDSGATQEQAGQQAGLTKGQVKYWLGKFRQVRMAIFPEQVPNVEEMDQVSEAKPADEKVKSAKGSKKGKKSKKKKKGKKDKKSKKKKGKGQAKKKKTKKNKKKS
jgi:hypothetical protein